MANSSSCYSLTCGEVVAENIEVCPRCGGRMLTSRSVRRLGWALTLMGLIITVFIGMITVHLLPSLVPIHGISAPARFNGTPDQAKLVLQIFFLLIGFGIAITLNGIIQVSTGQRNRIALFVSLGLAALIVITGYGIVRPI